MSNHHNSRSHQNKIFGIVPTKMNKKNTGRTEAGIISAACIAVGGPVLFKAGEAAAVAKWVDADPKTRDNPAAGGFAITNAK